MMNIIERWGDLDFLISDAKDWFWLSNIVVEVLLSPFFALGGLLLGIVWLVYVVRQPITSGAAGPVPVSEDEIPPISFQLGGVQWDWTGDFWVGGAPEIEKRCPKHHVKLTFQPHDGSPNEELGGVHRVDTGRQKGAGTLYCAEGPHTLTLSAESVSWGEMEGQVAAIMEGRISSGERHPPEQTVRPEGIPPEESFGAIRIIQHPLTIAQRIRHLFRK